MRAFALVPACLAALTVTAGAADLLPPPPPPVVVAQPVGTGWYLRGDFTRTFFDAPSDGLRPDTYDPDRPALVGLRLNDTSGGGGGVGYHVTPWLRLDVTIDQRASSRFAGFSSRSAFATGGNIETGRADVLTGLFNAYADLGTWWGLTPYVGAGIGFSDTHVNGAFTQTACAVDACDGAPGIGPRIAVLRPSRSVASFAYALTAGVSFAVGYGFSIDAAYRYVGLGPIKTGADSYGYATRLKDIAANEFRIGLRYDIPGFGDVVRVGSNPYGN
ncbi:outer membrane beta-barrel protein [Methylobacterium sp. NEAU 140]|uniref:outer membrane protein n=1 Tax=Methylobacterium sp. NEAU 140 TaxID=3064945 RepID=UPI0027374F6A|nr:outer membrane beta-barrel protein [Methylobacterium sp. NEAU 140]MDP4021653.1 outer membrane beta-barrel protein [Methylobacterium sp. NEAU 140]